MDDNLNELEALREENEKLKAKNDKLYKDCVSFAKKIKAIEDATSKLAELEAENESLKAEISRLASTERIAEYSEPDLISEPEEPVVPATIIEEPAKTYPEFAERVNTEPAPYVEGDDVIPKNHTTYKKSGFRTFIRVILWIVFVIALIVSVCSAIAYAFSTTYEEYAVAGYRFSSVINNTVNPDITTDDVVLYKYSNFDGIELGTYVMTTKDTKSIAKITGLDRVNGVNVATVEDNHGEYVVNENQFIGPVKLTVPYVGQIVQYACANQYNYLAIVLSVDLVCLALLLLIPSNKAKEPKFGKDYTVEDFTI
ncbi:MAG: cell division protein ZapB [Clostridia bacterium]|nr:cell division protein ZapB [Clostridia bacterium]